MQPGETLLGAPAVCRASLEPTTWTLAKRRATCWWRRSSPHWRCCNGIMLSWVSARGHAWPWRDEQGHALTSRGPTLAENVAGLLRTGDTLQRIIQCAVRQVHVGRGAPRSQPRSSQRCPPALPPLAARTQPWLPGARGPAECWLFQHRPVSATTHRHPGRARPSAPRAAPRNECVCWRWRL